MSKGQQQITTLDDEDESPARTATPDKAQAMLEFQLEGGTGRKKIITIHHGDGVLGASAAFISINGHAWQIPRGVPVKVPEEILEALDNAVQTVYEQVDKAMVPREVRRFPYSEYSR